MPSDLIGAVIHLFEQQQSPAFGGHDSLIKARYASTVLRVAQTVDQQTAVRLVSGLSRDFPCPTERPEIAELHFRAINSFSELATALYNETASKRQQLWNSAMEAAAAWLNAVIRL